MSGYTDCACRDCFDVAMSDVRRHPLCSDCEDAGCEPFDHECCREDAYGEDGLVDDEDPPGTGWDREVCDLPTLKVSARPGQSSGQVSATRTLPGHSLTKNR
jgi:hypothetical protein